MKVSVGYARAVISKLVEDYLRKIHTLYVNNLDTIIPLCVYLLEQRKHIIRALTTNRNNVPPKLLM